MNWKQYSGRLKANGVAIHKGDTARITGFVVKNDRIEFQLDGGGFGTFFDDSSTTVNPRSVDKSDYEKQLERDIANTTDEDKRRRRGAPVRFPLARLLLGCSDRARCTGAPVTVNQNGLGKGKRPRSDLCLEPTTGITCNYEGEKKSLGLRRLAVRGIPLGADDGFAGLAEFGSISCGQ